VVPHGLNTVIGTLGQVVHLKDYWYDHREDREYEIPEDEPPSMHFDNHLPKKVKVRTVAANPNLSSVLNTPAKVADDQKSFTLSAALRKSVASKLKQMLSSASQTPDVVQETPQQVLLVPGELKPYEVMTDEQKL
jgi:hypothetical protein